jgi:hypothetical protein
MMTIQAWNIVLNAIVAVVLVAYGLWLKNIVTQQLKNKDTAVSCCLVPIQLTLKSEQGSSTLACCHFSHAALLSCLPTSARRYLRNET